ncbi:ribosome maturation factor RimP [Thermoleophilia bacterium SCSIO 60948]|nr:ribosome maturation factor RimP [Thermoleophilia bacterium SCSIO 60948]
MTQHEELERTITERLADIDRELELVALEQPAAARLRVFIDRPGGVDLEACERVTAACRDLLVDYSLEVSSPGADRPLTKPEHFRRYLGRQVRVLVRNPIDGQRKFTGELVEADDAGVALSGQGRSVRIELGEIRRSNLVPDPIGGKA